MILALKLAHLSSGKNLGQKMCFRASFWEKSMILETFENKYFVVIAVIVLVDVVIVVVIHNFIDAFDILDVLAKTPSLYQVQELRYRVNLIIKFSILTSL